MTKDKTEYITEKTMNKYIEFGKQEQKKEIDNALIKYSKLRLYRSRSCQLLIKQLQKEIGGNEK